jgi:hypothetical protein
MLAVHDLSALRTLARRLKVPPVALRTAEKRLFKLRLLVDEALAALPEPTAEAWRRRSESGSVNPSIKSFSFRTCFEVMLALRTREYGP